MRERFQIPTALWSVQYQLLGGHRRMIAVAVVYAIVVMAGAYGVRRVCAGEPISTVAAGIINGLCFIQFLIVVPGSCNAVYKATLRDYESRMIESHRLTPMAGLSVALGYLVGSTLQVQVLFLINCALGVALSVLGGLPVNLWLYGNAVLLSGAVMYCAMFVFAGMRPAKPFNPATALLGIALLSFPLMVIPGGGLMLGVYSVLLPMWIVTGRTVVPTSALIVVVVVNVILACFWLSAAAAKYRRPDLPALNGFRGLMLLLVWLIVGVGGLLVFQSLAATNMMNLDEHGGGDFVRFQWIATMVGSLIVAAVAVSGAASCRILVLNGAAPRGWADRLPDTVVVLIAVVLIGSLSFGVGVPIWRAFVETDDGDLDTRRAAVAWFFTLASCALALLALRGFLAWCHARLKSPGVLIGLLILLTWGAPPLVDVLRSELTRGSRDPLELSWLLGCSPIGTLMAVWAPLQISLWPGLFVQGAIVLCCTLLGRVRGHDRLERQP